MIDGARYSVPGDHARVRVDGSIQLLGRGSQCINTAGEKVYPEEVEEVLKRHPLVVDACVVGIPDDRTGERIIAAVETMPGADLPSEAEIIEHYKAPKGVRFVVTIGRAANGKMEYSRHKAEAIAWVAES